MGSDIILCMALIASFAFVIQFLLSILGSDLDTDIDIDSASDLSMSLSDIISFKGITHFILGYSWTTYFSGSHLVGQDSEAQIKKAEAEKNASIGYNNAQKEVAVSVSELQIIKAQSEKKAGEEKVKSEAAVKTAKELADKEVEEAKAKKVQAALKAEKIVPAETQKEEAILQADAEAEKIKRRAEAEAAAHLAKAEAEAKAIQMKLEAEAEGKKKSLMAEADGFKAMVEAAESNPQIAIQYKMVNQWKEIAGEQVKAFEHINLGNITVFDGGQNSTGNFLNNVVKTVAPALGVIDQLPIADTLKKLKGDDKK